MISRIFEEAYEQVSFFSNPKLGLNAIIVIHSTKRGPALGGCRFKSYNSPNDALDDVLKLSKAMTLKAAAAELPLGGGKAVIIKKEGEINREAIFKGFGEFVNRLNGHYITAEDLGTTADDMEIIGQVTPFVRGKASSKGDPSPYTAQGVFLSIHNNLDFFRDLGYLKDSTPSISIQGIGAVGSKVAELALKEGYRVYVSDIDKEKLDAFKNQHPGVEIVPSEAIFEQESDIFCPCAIGGVVNPNTLSKIQSRIIIGGANNQLSGEECYELLRDKRILYGPDFIVNAGGLIKVASENMDNAEAWTQKMIAKIPERVRLIFEDHLSKGIPTERVALQIAMKNLG